MMAMIAAAGDLRRFDLAAANGRGSAQVLWSRTQGLAVSATGVPAPPPGQTYQVWLLTANTATNAGLLPVDDAGRASLVVASPVGLPRPIVRAAITLEPAGGSGMPTGAVTFSTPSVAVSAPGP